MVTQKEIINIRCLYCGKKDFRFFFRKPKSITIRCENCGCLKKINRDIKENSLRKTTIPLNENQLFSILKKVNPDLLIVVQEEKIKLRRKINKNKRDKTRKKRKK